MEELVLSINGKKVATSRKEGVRTIIITYHDEFTTVNFSGLNKINNENEIIDIFKKKLNDGDEVVIKIKK